MTRAIKDQRSTIENYLKHHPAAKEYRFMLECCRAVFAPEQRTLAFPEGIDSNVFLRLLQQHKLETHLYPLLKNRCEGIPPSFLSDLKILLQRHSLRVLRLSGELTEISDLFRKNDLRWVSLKGPALSVQLYGDVAVRQSGDLDILVQREDLDKAIKIVTERGYVPEVDYTKFTTAQIRFTRKYYKDMLFRHSVSGILMELHWLIDNDRKIPLNQNLFGSGMVDSVQIGNRGIPVFSEAFNCLYLCLHGSRHAWYRLFWLWDFATLLKSMTSEQADRMINDARKYKSEKLLAQAVALSADIFSVKAPDSLVRLSGSRYMTKSIGRFIFTENYMSLKNAPYRVIYKIKTFSVPFFFSYYFRRSVTFLLRKNKGVK